VHIDGMCVYGEIALYFGELLPAIGAFFYMSRNEPGFVLAKELHGKESQIFRFDMSGQAHA
jgi:hypothetical protein